MASAFVVGGSYVLNDVGKQLLRIIGGGRRNWFTLWRGRRGINEVLPEWRRFYLLGVKVEIFW